MPRQMPLPGPSCAPTARHRASSAAGGARSLEMRNDSHHECERHWISERGARRRRFAWLKVIFKNTGLRRGAVNRRLVVICLPAALGLLEGEQRLVNCVVDE